MKTMLVLTDFTENAAHAALSVIRLSEKLHANILLLNVNLSQPVMPEYIGGPTVIDNFNFWEEESREKLHQMAESLAPLIAQPDPNQRKPVIQVDCGIANMALAVEEAIKQKDIELIVMGARAGTPMDHILGGSETRAVIDNSTRPVLVVPLNTGLDKFHKVVFATDYQEADIDGIHYLVKLGKLFNFHLEIVHVNLPHDNDIMEKAKEEAFLKQVHKLKYPHISFKEIYGKDVKHRLNIFCNEIGANLLAVTHYKNSFMKRLFKHSTTQKALTDQSIPILIFPSEMKDY